MPLDYNASMGQIPWDRRPLSDLQSATLDRVGLEQGLGDRFSKRLDQAVLTCLSHGLDGLVHLAVVDGVAEAIRFARQTQIEMQFDVDVNGPPHPALSPNHPELGRNNDPL